MPAYYLDGDRKVGPELEYTCEHINAQHMLKQINELLHDMPAPDCDDVPIRWMDVAQIQEVNKRLRAVVAFLNNTER